MESNKDGNNYYLGKRVDPIPPSLKELYFKQEMPNYSKDYDCLGFDADHCIVKYNLEPYTRLLIQCDLEDMHENGGWPEEILEFDLTEGSEEIAICNNFTLWDIDRGTLLKLGEGKEVLAAMKGRKSLSQGEI